MAKGRPRYAWRYMINNCKVAREALLETDITISSQSTEVSLRENDLKYFGHYTCKQQEETCANKHIYKEMHNQDHHENEQVWHEYGQCENKNKYFNADNELL